MNASVSARLNVDLIDEKYRQWSHDPQSVEATWAAFFEGFELGEAQIAKREEEATGGLSEEVASMRARVVSLVYTYRTLGHTMAHLDPLSESAPEQPLLHHSEFGFSESDLERPVATQFFRGGERMLLRELIAELRQIYCDTIGFEFMHIHHAEVRNWIRERVEARIEQPLLSAERQKQILRWLIEAEGFEHFLHKKYVGQKRFSLEGGESLMVILNTLLERSPHHQVQEIVMGMAHRGRLTVLANFLQKPLPIIFSEFSENYVPDLVAGDGDVKYHLGYETDRPTSTGELIKIILAANPSHLEAVNPVVEGMARARQRIVNEATDRSAVLPLLVHGDAAFAGQGIVAEVLNLSQLPGYRTGGTVHIVVNNQIGFTTTPADARSTVYATDVAKMIEAPIFHVNGDDPAAVQFVSELAFEFRQRFARDVIIDMYCYRRHGHNEGDEPIFTLPKMVQSIRAHQSTGVLYQRQLENEGVLSENEGKKMRQEHEERMNAEHEELQSSGNRESSDAFTGSTAVFQPAYDHSPTITGITEDQLNHLGKVLSEAPSDFAVNQKMERLFLERRRKVITEGGPFDWSFAEALAFGSLLMEGNHVRLSGQDSRRGTFSHRHAVLYDVETRERYIPLNHISETQAKFCVYNSLLSEAAVLGFDYGYSLGFPSMLTLWEAQFGDFANGAQVIIDQFITSAESKWQKPSGIVLLLPHGYEGQGPEHSSARLERFLQLSAENNIQVCNLTTPAQYFHALRRQMRRPFRKPLIIMTPKSLLRFPDATSRSEDFLNETHFRTVLDCKTIDHIDKVNRLIFCSGKVYYDLLRYRNEQNLRNVAVIRLEQLYPFDEEAFRAVVERYPRSCKWVWAQEEPLNMGAWHTISPTLERLAHHPVRYSARPASSSPAVGSLALHKREQQKLVANAFQV